MQNTRLNTFVAGVSQQLRQQLRNPWRRISVMVIALLFGIYLGVAFSAIAGQIAYLDTTAAAIILVIAEFISWLFYTNRGSARRRLWGNTLNALKLGITYGLFLVAFILGS